jgi:hypothetical protein
MSLSPQTVDYLIITAFEILEVLAKHLSGEEISDDDLKLESWEETLKRVKNEKALRTS